MFIAAGLEIDLTPGYSSNRDVSWCSAVPHLDYSLYAPRNCSSEARAPKKSTVAESPNFCEDIFTWISSHTLVVTISRYISETVSETRLSLLQHS